MAIGNDVIWTQVVTWNHDVGSYCDGIDAISTFEFVLCVRNPGGTWECLPSSHNNIFFRIRMVILLT